VLPADPLASVHGDGGDRTDGPKADSHADRAGPDVGVVDHHLNGYGRIPQENSPARGWGP